MMMQAGNANFSLSGSELVDLIEPFLQGGEPIKLRVRGASMQPLIQDGDLVTLAPAGNGEIGLGDVVAVRRRESSGIVLHRVVKIAPGGFLIQGDNAGRPDGVFDPRSILGRVTQVERNGRNIWFAKGELRYLMAHLVRHRLLVRWNILRGLSRREGRERLRQALVRRLYYS
jgi:signal peptidase I